MRGRFPGAARFFKRGHVVPAGANLNKLRLPPPPFFSISCTPKPHAVRRGAKGEQPSKDIAAFHPRSFGPSLATFAGPPPRAPSGRAAPLGCAARRSHGKSRAYAKRAGFTLLSLGALSPSSHPRAEVAVRMRHGQRPFGHPSARRPRFPRIPQRSNQKASWGVRECF